MKRILQRVIRLILPTLEAGLARMEKWSDKRAIRRYRKRKGIRA